MNLSSLEPQAVWHQFQLLCDTPRPSNHEALLKQRIKERLLEANAKELNIEIHEDRVGNLILRKPATSGCERATGVILQSHLDMVTQQNEGTGHDFYNDPLSIRVEGDWVSAEGTTLGADNGIGVAAIIAVFCSNDIIHGPLEAILTINEESGMTGAKGLEPGLLNGKWLLNLDTEEEGELYIGCAGGVDITSRWQYQEEKPDTALTFFKINLKGLKGGHSGIDIHRGRGNAVKLINRTVTSLGNAIPELRVASVCGGTLRNAIPREAFAIIGIPSDQCARLENQILQLETLYQKELGPADPGLRLSVESCQPQSLIPAGLWQSIQLSITACLNGVLRMNTEFTGVTETSNNLASVRAEKGNAEIQCLTRSLLGSQQREAAATVAAAFLLAGGEVISDGEYPGWQPRKDSVLLSELNKLHKQTTGCSPKIQVIHAGLECGILGANYPDWDMISFGPTIQGAHSPDETVKISSVKTFWDFLQASLKHLASL